MSVGYEKAANELTKEEDMPHVLAAKNSLKIEKQVIGESIGCIWSHGSVVSHILCIPSMWQ